ncbi:MAG: protein kinase [Planctomycetota bacterium]
MNSPRSETADCGEHPAADLLERYAVGRCDAVDAAVIEAHVLTCDECCAKLADAPRDLLLSQLAAHSSIAGDTDRGLAATDVQASLNKSANSNHFADRLSGHPKYRFVREIGAGGMGVVYQAEHRVMNRMVALKVIAPRLLQDEDVKIRFRREVEIAAKLQHPNVVAAFDADEIDGHLFLVSEYIDGQSVDQRIQPGGMPIEDACRIIQQAAAALDHSHQHGLIHRDIKPQNMLVSSDGLVKVVDFGLASYIEPNHANQQGLTSAGIIVGTPDYLSPEQAREGKVDHRADIYSLGCTFYHLLAGAPPFGGGSRVEKLAKHLQEQPKSLGEIRPEVPPPLEACVAKMMAKDPAQRFASARGVIDAIESHFQSGLPTIRTAAPTAGRRRSASPSRRSWLGCTAVAAAGLAAAGYTAWPTGKELEDVRLLAVFPNMPLPRDQKNLWQACEQAGLGDQVIAAAATPRSPQFQWNGNFVPLDRVKPGDYDGIIMVGSHNNAPTELTDDPNANARLRGILKEMEERGKPIATLCSGIWPLTRVGSIRGKSVAGCVHTSPDFKAMSGATWLEDEKLVIDGDLITCSNEQDATPLLDALLKHILG